MGIVNLINKIGDSFKAADFEISSRMKLKTLSKNFSENFGLSLRIYKGQHIADGNLTLNQLNNISTTTNLNKEAGELKIKASMKVGDVEKLFNTHFGVNVQIANFKDTKLSDNNMTLGEARRAE